MWHWLSQCSFCCQLARVGTGDLFEGCCEAGSCVVTTSAKAFGGARASWQPGDTLAAPVPHVLNAVLSHWRRQGHTNVQQTSCLWLSCRWHSVVQRPALLPPGFMHNTVDLGGWSRVVAWVKYCLGHRWDSCLTEALAVELLNHKFGCEASTAQSALE